MKKRKFIVLCCGSGQSTKGFLLDERWECAGCIDVNGEILMWHHRNIPEAPIFELDLNTITIAQLVALVGTVDLVLITASCVGISTAGLFDPFDGRNSLLIRCIRMLRYLNPKAALVENVSGIKKGRMKAFYWIVVEELLQLSDQFVFQDRIINGLHLNTPQRRKRWFTKLYRRDLEINPTWPELDLQAAEHFRIRDLFPQYEYLTYGFHDKNNTRQEKILLPGDFLPTLTATPCLRIPGGANLPIEDVERGNGVAPGWLSPDEYLFAHLMLGNGFLTPMAHAFAKNIADDLDNAGID